MKPIITVTTLSIFWILGGLYQASFIIGYLRGVADYQLQRHPKPDFPITPILIGTIILFIGIILILSRNKVEELINYKRNLKIILSMIFILIETWLYHRIYYSVIYLLSIPQILVSDYDLLFPLVWFLFSIAFSFAVWFVLLSFTFHIVRKVIQSLSSNI